MVGKHTAFFYISSAICQSPNFKMVFTTTSVAVSSAVARLALELLELLLFELRLANVGDGERLLAEMSCSST